MRIGYITYGLDRAPTGIGRYSIELLRALAVFPDAPEIVLLTTEREDRHGLWNAFKTHHLPGCRLAPALITWGNAALSAAVARYKLDIVHDPNGIAPFLGPRFGARRVVTIYDAFAYVHPETHNRLDNWRYHAMLPYSAQHADAITTISMHSCHDIVQYLDVPEAKIAITSCGINQCFRPIPAGAERDAVLHRYGISGRYILYVGSINARKNVARLFEAYARLHAHLPDVTLVVAGKRQWQTAEIDATFQRLNLEGKVHFTGYVDDADLPALYSAADVFVFPSLYEGFGLPPLEAMACGTPVVTSNVSSLPEVIGDAALTIDPYDVGALTAAITQALTDEPLRATLRRRGIARAAQFTWERTARETLAVYEHILSGK